MESDQVVSPACKRDRDAGHSSRRSGPPRWLIALALAAIPTPLFADTILLTFQSITGAVPIIGAGTSAAILNYGTVSAFEPLNPGVTRTRTASDYKISTQFGIRVTRLLGTTASYNVQARLQSASTVTWQVDGVTMSTSAALVATLQPYGSVLPHTLAFIVPYTGAAGSITPVVEVTVIAN